MYGGAPAVPWCGPQRGRYGVMQHCQSRVVGVTRPQLGCVPRLCGFLLIPERSCFSGMFGRVDRVACSRPVHLPCLLGSFVRFTVHDHYIILVFPQNRKWYTGTRA